MDDPYPGFFIQCSNGQYCELYTEGPRLSFYLNGGLTYLKGCLLLLHPGPSFGTENKSPEPKHVSKLACKAVLLQYCKTGEQKEGPTAGTGRGGGRRFWG